MTRQIPDVLIYENKKIDLNRELLAGYFREFPNEQPEEDVVCSALWRGYVATFEIKDNTLIIRDINLLTTIDFGFESYLNKSLSSGEKFEWFSGLIRIDDFGGEFDEEPKDGIFELLEIRNGDLIQKRSMNYDEFQAFKEEQFQYFMMSDELHKIYDFFRQNNDKIVEARVDEIIRENIIYYTKEVYVD